MPEFTVGQKVRNRNGIETTVVSAFERDPNGFDTLVRDRNNYVLLVRSSDWSPIPDTVTVQLDPRDAELVVRTFVDMSAGHIIHNLGTSAYMRIIDSCRAALGGE